MFESLLEWCVFPVYVHRFLEPSASGDAVYAEPTIEYGYRVDEMRRITDKTGTDYVSFSHVYFPPSTAIAIADKLSFPDDTTVREIKKLGGNFDGNTGLKSITVAYL